MKTYPKPIKTSQTVFGGFVENPIISLPQRKHSRPKAISTNTCSPLHWVFPRTTENFRQSESPGTNRRCHKKEHVRSVRLTGRGYRNPISDLPGVIWDGQWPPTQDNLKRILFPNRAIVRPGQIPLFLI